MVRKTDNFQAYYTKWMKDKIAKKQKAQWEAKKERLSERQRLLREWESDQRGRYERTLGLGLHFSYFLEF